MTVLCTCFGTPDYLCRGERVHRRMTVLRGFETFLGPPQLSTHVLGQTKRPHNAANIRVRVYNDMNDD
jgi:hypothetical protein